MKSESSWVHLTTVLHGRARHTHTPYLPQSPRVRFLLESHVKVVVATLKRLVHINGTMASPVVGTTFNAIKSVALSCCVLSQLHLSDSMQLCTVSCLLCDAVISPLRRAYLVFTISCRHVWPHTHTSESRVSLENSACSSIPHFFSLLMYYMPMRL